MLENSEAFENNEPPFQIEDTLPFSEEPQSGDLDHNEASDDSETQVGTVSVTQEEAESGPDHPSNPAVVPIQPEKKHSHFVVLSAEEQAEKGRPLAKKLKEIEGLKEERTELNGDIKDLEEEVIKIRDSLISGTVEVLTEQTDLLRQPVGPESAAAQFAEMGAAAEAAALPGVADAAQEATEGLNAMAAGIQAEQGIEAPGPTFLNDIEEHKAKSAAKRKNGKAR